MTARDALAAIRLRAAVATEGPWTVDLDEPTGVVHPDKPDGFDGVMIAYLVDHDAGMFPREHNGAFIAHARTDVPALVEALEAVLDAIDRADPPGAMRAGTPSVSLAVLRAALSPLERTP